MDIATLCLFLYYLTLPVPAFESDITTLSKTETIELLDSVYYYTPYDSLSRAG